MKRHWRPNLAMLLGGALLGTLALSYVGLVALRYLGPEIGFREAAVVLGLCILAATTLLGSLLWRLLIRPIRGLQAYAASVRRAPHHIPDPPLHFGTTELLATGDSVIAMAQTLNSRETALRAYSDHVTHELKTPVSALRAAVELLEDGPSLTDADRQLVVQISGATTQIETQLDALRAAVRAREPRYIGFCTLESLAPTLRNRHPQLDLRFDGARCALPLQDTGLSMVLDQLLQNALAHGANAVWMSAKSSQNSRTLIVSDNGEGISDGNRSRVLDPFFTTRRETGGTGMGLTIVSNILAAHGATLHLGEQDTGARFEIQFPSD